MSKRDPPPDAFASACAGAGVSKSDPPPEAFAAGPVSACSVIVAPPLVASPAAGSAATGVFAGVGRLGNRRLALDRGQQQLGDVEDLDLLAGAAGGLLLDQAVGEHHPAERAADGDLVGAGRDGLRVRLTLTRSPIVSSIHIRAPPAPQQKDRSELRGISVSVASGITSSSSRGGA